MAVAWIQLHLDVWDMRSPACGYGRRPVKQSCLQGRCSFGSNCILPTMPGNALSGSETDPSILSDPLPVTPGLAVCE
jgi:hypothetical protein